MTSLSPSKIQINMLFFRDAAALYSGGGLAPATEASAGVDLRACLDDPGQRDGQEVLVNPEGEKILIIPPGERRAVKSGIAIEPLAPGMAGFVYSRSGLGAAKGITVAQGVGLIDPDYRGEIRVFLLNTSRAAYALRHGERIAQLVFQPFARPEFKLVEELGRTARGAGGFGHTGRA